MLRNFSLYNLAQNNAVTFADRIAVVDGQHRITYREFLAVVERFSGGLLEAGLTPGDRVAVLARNSFEYFALYFAAARTGSIVVPINFRLSVEEVEYIIKDSEPRLLITDAETCELAARSSEKAESLERRLIFGQQEPGFDSFDDLLKDNGPAAIEETGPDDPLYIIYSAAVGGNPRGIVITQGNIMSDCMQMMVRLGLGPDDAFLGFLPLFHAAGLMFALNTYAAGGKNVFMPAFDPAEAVSLIDKEGCSILFTFAPIMSKLLDQAEQDGIELSSLRLATGLEQAPAIDRLQTMTPAVFWSAYGQAETTNVVLLSPYGERPGSAGRPLPMCCVELVDDYDRPVEVGQVGEIVVRGPLVFQGYWGLPADTERTFREGWHHTGDQARKDEDGYFFFAGRKAEKELIKPGGENVYPVEVEKAILEHPQVKETSVIGVPDSKWGEGIKAVCVLEPDADLTASDLIEFVGARIARYKKPQYVEFVPSLPKSDDGSIDRDKVKADYGAGA